MTSSSSNNSLVQHITFADKVIRFDELGLPEDLHIIGKVSQGGMGVILKAQHKRTKTLLAVKLLVPKQASERQDTVRFKREARAISSLSSKHIVKVQDYGCAKYGIPYLVMDYIDGITLMELPAIKTPTTEEAVDVFAQIGEALAHAHQKGIVHRDLKPSNIMASLSPEGHIVVRIIDFGIAKLATADDDETLLNITSDGDVLGTPNYMAPEQALGEPLDHRCDIYSLGCVMFYVLTGQPPFVGATPMQVLAQRTVSPSAPPITSVRKDIPRGLSLIVDRCLERKPEDRYQTATELLMDLKTYSHRQAIPTRLSGNERRALQKWLVLAAIVFLTFFLGFGIFSFLNVIHPQ